MPNLHVKCVILLDDGMRYYYSECPGVAVPEFSYARGTTVEEEWNNFKNYAHSQFDFEYNQNSLFDDIVKCLFLKIGFIYDVVIENTTLPFYVLIDDMLIEIRNLNYSLNDFLVKYKVENELNIYLIYWNRGGSIWRDDGVEYFMNSKESGSHNRPHVHIDYKHEKEASVAIDNGELLAGTIPKKILRVVQKRIEGNKEFLFECWNSMTDGLYIDVNHYFGKKKIEEIDKIRW